MNFKKMGSDFLKAGGPAIIGGIITGLTILATNFDSYFEDEGNEDGENE